MTDQFENRPDPVQDPTPKAEPSPQEAPAPAPQEMPQQPPVQQEEPQQQVPPQTPYNTPFAPPAGSSYPPYGTEPPVQPPKKKGRAGWIIGLIALYLVLAAVVIGLIASGALRFGEEDGRETGENVPATEEKTTNAPIVQDPDADADHPIVDKDYSGEILSYASLYEKCVPSVVFVQANYRNGTSTGSGFVIDSQNGYILTNHHVVDGSNDLAVTFANGDSYTAKLVGSDAINDVAVLRIETAGLELKNVTVGNSDKIRIGDAVLVIGNPLGDLTFTMTGGIVSGKDRSINTGEYTIKTFQTDAAINSGNSGGPAFDSTGAVIGIASAKYAATGVEGIGFCIPINDALRIANDLVNYGYVKGRPNFGITVSDSLGYEYTTDEYGRRVMIETARGARIEEVGKDSCAQKAGLQAGDIVTKLGDKKILTANDLINAKNTSYKAGDSASIEVYRGGKYLTLTIVFDEYSPE